MASESKKIYIIINSMIVECHFSFTDAFAAPAVSLQRYPYVHRVTSVNKFEDSSFYLQVEQISYKMSDLLLTKIFMLHFSPFCYIFKSYSTFYFCSILQIPQFLFLTVVRYIYIYLWNNIHVVDESSA